MHVCLCMYACMCLYNFVAIICIFFFYMFITLNNTCGKTVLMMEEEQGLCHLSLYCKVVFSKILHHATLPFQKERKK